MEIPNVLLVDDNSINQFIVSAYLRKWNMRFAVANNGMEALTIIQEQSFHIVLMDLQMPVMDGFEATRKIRALTDPFFKTMPIIAFTASTLIMSKEHAMEFAMTDFIGKPFLPETLREKIILYTKHLNVCV